MGIGQSGISVAKRELFLHGQRFRKGQSICKREGIESKWGKTGVVEVLKS